MPPSSVGQHFIGSTQPYSQLNSNFGPGGAVGNVSGYRCVSDCISRGRDFDSGPVPYFRGDWSWKDFYGHSPPFRWSFKKGCCQLKAKQCARSTDLLAQEKVWVCELTQIELWPDLTGGCGSWSPKKIDKSIVPLTPWSLYREIDFIWVQVSMVFVSYWWYCCSVLVQTNAAE